MSNSRQRIPRSRSRLSLLSSSNDPFTVHGSCCRTALIGLLLASAYFPTCVTSLLSIPSSRLRATTFKQQQCHSHSPMNQRYGVGATFLASRPSSPDESEQRRPSPTSSASLSRRDAISLFIASTAIATVASSSTAASAAATETTDFQEPLEELALGNGQWRPLNEESSPLTESPGSGLVVTPTFATYLTRFLIRYDQGVNQWWVGRQNKYALMSPSDRQDKLDNDFGALACSLQSGLNLSSDALWDQLMDRYGSFPDAPRQISLLFALLPPEQQPMARLNAFLKGTSTTTLVSDTTTTTSTREAVELWDSVKSDLTSLLPLPFHCELASNGQGAVIVPHLLSSAFMSDSELEDATRANRPSDTPFGPLAAIKLTRELPAFSPLTYTLFGVSGATGCAITHAIVIPLDVVKTRAQTNPLEKGSNMVGAAVDIVKNEGFEALLLGAQATIAGYFWYGLSVYPSYTFFKRFLTLDIFPPEAAMVHANDISLLAGAMAAVVASLGLTPIEAARIRVVAEPEKYRPLGLSGTLQLIAQEDPSLGWQTWYAGFPSLLTRQVIFGSVKFIAFERACEAIFSVWPSLRELTLTSLAVSLMAGGFSGALSSVVSQPADSLLTFVAQNNNNQDGKGGATMGLLEGCRIMVEQDGPSSLFRGLGSRCVWAGSIIAGQFLLYDVFRTYFHVSATDLSQVYQVAVT